MGSSELHLRELDRILAERLLTPLFQPLAQLSDGQVIGYEALIRGPSDSALHSPALLFKTAQAFDRLEELEILCRELSIQAFAQSKLPAKLFLNVNPMLLLTRDHPVGLTRQLVDSFGLEPDRIVIELSEQFQVEDTELFVSAVKHYRQYGFTIAIDDLGSGFSGLKLWSELQPDIVKIDRYFIDQLHRDPVKRSFVRNIIQIAKSTGSLIVAEGIESSEELLICRELGADVGQGYLLGRPQTAAQQLPINPQLFLHSSSNASQELLASITLPVPAVAIDSSAARVADQFVQDTNLQCLAVVDADQHVVGIVSRNLIHERFSHPFGRALYERKPISQCMEAKPLLLDCQMSIDAASAMLTSEVEDDTSLFFVITQHGRYFGLGSVRHILKQITERKIQLARYANPLTQLPGNVPINAEIDQRLQQQPAFSIAYLDIDHFKPYNDVYGYSKGDLVIELLAQIIQAEAQPSDDFIGHIGGDDFIILLPANRALKTIKRIVQNFDQRVRHYYTAEHLASEGFYSTDRLGNATFMPLISLSVGIATPDHRLCRSHHDVSALASAAKQQAKRRSGSFIFISRRRGPGQKMHTRKTQRSA